MRLCLHKRNYKKSKDKLPDNVINLCNKVESICISCQDYNEFINTNKKEFKHKFGHKWVIKNEMLRFSVKVKGKNQYRIIGFLKVSNNTIYLLTVAHRKDAYNINLDEIREEAFNCK